MKLFISSEPQAKKEEYAAVHNFTEFVQALAQGESVAEMYIDSYLLGLVCLYWYIDHFREKMKTIKYTINLKDPNQSECLKQMVKRYTKEDK